ncbi:hypothetical protein GCM10025876_21320 [Demequina litorisediminis]|uniref:Uncharacterized protein n=1 Tax=Demequina litorisediminis TaxID=1849022 RepID=A0ABQ6IGR6_9MICO|nr:hypothetical protein GCM10025876_21320 [Demequina litorisediminis]
MAYWPAAWASPPWPSVPVARGTSAPSASLRVGTAAHADLIRVGAGRTLGGLHGLAQERVAVHALERELAEDALAVRVHADNLARGDLAEEDLLRQRVLDLALECAAQRSRTEHGVVTLLGEQASWPHPTGSIAMSLSRMRSSRRATMRSTIWMISSWVSLREHHHVVDAVEELRLEVLLEPCR